MARHLSGTQRTIVLIVVTAVLALAAGMVLSRLIVSPAQAAADAAPPEAGPITVPAELRVLANDVVIRGDATYEGSTELTLESGDMAGPAIVTGQIPEVGSSLDAGDVALEVTGRPVILLQGELPVFRTLRVGSEGPDVVQLKEALDALGLDPGRVSSPVYDAETAAAVDRLYRAAGYPPPAPAPEAEASLVAARDGVRMARDQISSLEAELRSLRAGPSEIELESARATAMHCARRSTT